MNLYPPLPDIEDLLENWSAEDEPAREAGIASLRFEKNIAATNAMAYSLEQESKPPLQIDLRKIPVPLLLFGYSTRNWFRDVQDAFRSTAFAQALAKSAAEPIPDFLQERFRRQAAAQPAEQLTPQPGQIRWFRQLDGQVLPRPFCFLLDQADEKGGWLAWMVAAEVDYACDMDILIEESDGPINLLAGMVQTWNPLSLKNSLGEVIGQLRAARLDVMRQAPSSPSPETPRPGHVHLRAVADATVLSGTPLGGNGDPRRQYQDIYRRLASRLSAHAY